MFNTTLVVILTGVSSEETLVFEMLHERDYVVKYPKITCMFSMNNIGGTAQRYRPFDLVNTLLHFYGQLINIALRLS
jgi:hypothetical protein